MKNGQPAAAKPCPLPAQSDQPLVDRTRHTRRQLSAHPGDQLTKQRRRCRHRGVRDGVAAPRAWRADVVVGWGPIDSRCASTGLQPQRTHCARLKPASVAHARSPAAHKATTYVDRAQHPAADRGAHKPRDWLMDCMHCPDGTRSSSFHTLRVGELNLQAERKRGPARYFAHGMCLMHDELAASARLPIRHRSDPRPCSCSAAPSPLFLQIWRSSQNPKWLEVYRWCRPHGGCRTSCRPDLPRACRADPRRSSTPPPLSLARLVGAWGSRPGARRPEQRRGQPPPPEPFLSPEGLERWQLATAALFRGGVHRAEIPKRQPAARERHMKAELR